MDNLTELQDRRAAALATMRAHIQNEAVFSIASRQEATLAAQIRRLRRHGNGADIPLTLDDADVFLRVSGNLERQYKIADRTDAKLTRVQMQRGGIVTNVKAEVRS